MIAFLRRLWRASSQPCEFFAALPREPRLGASIRAALPSVAVSSLVFSGAIARATSSDAWIPILVLVIPGALLYSATLWLLGGVAISRTAAIDIRGWEIAAWAWVPSGFMAMSLLPVVAVFPVTSLIVGLLGLPVWHLTIVHCGLVEFAATGRRRALLIYAVVVLLLPISALIVGILAALTI